MLDILIVVDMQNDFINGALGTKEAENILPYVKNLVKNFNGKVFFTRGLVKIFFWTYQASSDIVLCLERRRRQ